MTDHRRADERLEHDIDRVTKFIARHIFVGGALDAHLIFGVELNFPGLELTTFALALSRFLASKRQVMQ
jgi:hypothetical protein